MLHQFLGSIGMSVEMLLSELNAKQKEAVTSPLRNALVLAGAGSGKTRVLVSRIAWLIEQYQMHPQSILAVTFTNKAAAEMKERLGKLLPISLSGMWVGTFHGLCHRLLRRHYQDAHLPETFHILDSEDQSRVIKRVILGMNLDPDQWPIKQAQAFINSNKEEGLRPGHLDPGQYGPTRTWIQIYKNYEQACASAGVIDFADLILKTHELLRDNPAILEHYRQRFQAILVDEFQDTNTIQYAWIKLLAGNQAIVMVVGDDDQSIYGWRGAKIENIHHFSRDFKDAMLIRLEQNYRSTSNILTAANALITQNTDRLGKELWTEGDTGEKIIVYKAFNELDEARFVSERIKKYSGKLNNIAVLYRSNAQSRVLEEALLRSSIAYRIYGGVRYFDRTEVKDALAYLRLVANSNDDAAFERIVNFPTRGIGEKTLDELRAIAKTEQISLWTAIAKFQESTELGQRALTALNKFSELIKTLKNNIALMELDEQIAEVINTSGLYAHYSKVKGDKSEARLDNLQELINAAKQFRYEADEIDREVPLLTSFLAHASLEAGEMQAEEHEEYVHLMTLHAAKGLEFPLVFLVGMEEGLFPSKQSQEKPSLMEEERRLCYVGMTRAMQNLVLSYSEVRRQYGREEYHRPSRFLKELPQKLLDEIRVNTYVRTSSIKTQQLEEQSGLRLGQSVKHPTFGTGTVLAVEGSGIHTQVQVKFPEHGSKWLVLAYANLMPAEA
jgi:DNA helicase-2/ATP-dependent DNA helicase PcrA